MDDPHHHFNHTLLSFLTKGSQVEVGSNEDGFNAAWYVATVIHPPPPTHHTGNNLVYLQYHNILPEDASSCRLKEYVDTSYVRPSPAADTNPHSFQLNDLVDAFYRHAWRTGVITTVVDANNFLVTFQNPPDEVQFGYSDLRIHKKWVGGRWFQPQKQVTAGWMFTVGKKVEVSFDRESFRDVWFPATVLKNLGNSTFLVEYQQQGDGEEAILHKVIVDFHHIRPSPPHLKDKNFVFLEKVDAYYDFGWWSGVITKVIPDNRYNVFFKHTKKEREFIYSRVRPHMEWKGGKWYKTSQGYTVVRTAHSLIDNQVEQATPIIGKQSPVTTSIMKRKRQKNLDSNDKNSPKDEIMNHDSNKKNKKPSVSQSEGFDSEVSEMTDQAFSKTENLSHGKEVHSKQGKSIELKTPTTDSSRNRGRLTNELKSLQAVTKGSKVDLAKTRTQEIVGKKDATKDFPFAAMGLQRSGMTVSHEKIVQKPPNKNTPNVAKSDTKQPVVPPAPLPVVGQERSEGDAASVAPKRKRGRPPKLQAVSPKIPVIVNHEIGSVVPSTLSEVEAGQRKEVGLTTSSGPKSLKENQGPINEQPGLAQKHNDSSIGSVVPSTLSEVEPGQRKEAGLTTSSGTKSLEENQGPINEQPGLAGKQNGPSIGSVVPSTRSEVEPNQRKEAGLTTSSGTSSLKESQGPINEHPGLAGKQNTPLIKDKLPNEITGTDLNVHQGQGTKKYSATNKKRGRRRTICINTKSPAQVSQDASKEKADESLEKDSTKRNPEASVVSDNQSLSRLFEGQFSIHGSEGTVEQLPKANEERLEISQCELDSGNLPFVRTTSLWKTIESMEAFRMLPQKPHFRPLLEGVREDTREGLAIGSMVTFSTVVDKTCRLTFDDPRSTIEDCLETLEDLENHGFDVEVIRERLTGLLLIKDKQEELEEQSKEVVKKIKEHKIQGTKIEEEINEIKRQIKELEERRKQVLLKNEKRISEIAIMKTVIEGIEQEIRVVGEEFEGLAAGPFVTNNI